jgi:hypothetical protein
MAFPFDSLSLERAGALVLLAVSIWSWRATRSLRVRLRVQLRFAAVVLAAFAVSLTLPVPGLAFNVMLFAASVASAALALAFSFRRPVPPWLCTIILAMTFAMGLMASLAAMPLLALVSVEGAAAYILAVSISRLKDDAVSSLAAISGTVSLALGGLVMMDGGLGQAALFFASALGLVARALEKPVEHPDARMEFFIG